MGSRAKSREVGLVSASPNPGSDVVPASSGPTTAVAWGQNAIYSENSSNTRYSPRTSRRLLWVAAFAIGALVALTGWYLAPPRGGPTACVEARRPEPTPAPRVCGATASCRCNDATPPVADPSVGGNDRSGPRYLPSLPRPHHRSHRRSRL